MWQDFWWEAVETAEMISVQRGQGMLQHCRVCSSRLQDGSTAVQSWVNQWQLCRHQSQWRRRGRRCSRHWDRFPCSPWRRTGNILQLQESPTAEQADMPWKKLHAMDSNKAGSWQHLCTCGEQIPCWSRFSGRACDPVGNPHQSCLLLKDCIPWKETMLDQSMKKCSLWEGG